jgi:hypothetical protein
MTRAARLRREAKQAATWRGHDMARFVRVDVADGRATWDSVCRKCGKGVQVQPFPAANGIDIGGQAVALGCGG